MAFEELSDSVPVLTFTFIIGLTAFVGNGIIIFITVRYKNFRSTICNRFIGLLALSSFSEGLGLILTSTYAFYQELANVIEYKRVFCLGFALPGIFGVISSQLTMLWLAIDRLMAVRKPLTYFQDNSKTRFYITMCISLVCGLAYAIFAMLSKESKPTDQCSTGASVSKIFIGAYGAFSVIMAISIFTVYIAAVIQLIKRLKMIDPSVALPIQRQKSIFISISLILLFYAIFWCLPMFMGIFIIATNPNPILLSYSSLLIGICSGLNSCVGIFIYLAKHLELREYFQKLFPILFLTKKNIHVVMPMSPALSRAPSRLETGRRGRSTIF